MKIKKIVAISLAFFMTMGYLPEDILANPQKPIKSIDNITVGHKVTNTVGSELTIVPKVQVDWKVPAENSAPVDAAEDYTKEPTYYDFTITNMNDSSNVKTVEDIEKEEFGEDAEILSMNAEQYFRSDLKNGALYKMKITAKHKHTVEKDGYYTKVDAPLSGDKIPEAYFITDFNLKATANSGLTFEWEYIPGLSYYLYYEKGNKESISEMSGAGEMISADKAKAHLSEDGTQVSYTVEDSVAGQIYSAYILPIGLESKTIEFKEVYYNRESPKLIHVTPNIPLEVVPLGESKVRLSWDITQAAWVSIGNKLYQTVIWQIDETGKKTELGRIYNDNKGNQDIGYFECSAPTGTVTYQIDFILKNNDGNLEVGFSAGPKEYTPDELREAPYQPSIPKLFNYSDTEDLSHIITNQGQYKVKSDDLVLTNNNISEFKTHTFHYDIINNQANVQLVWDAPQVGTTGEIDYSLYYDIWVSENATSFDDDDKVVGNLKIDKGNTEELIYKQNGETVVGMKTILEGLKTNRTYYIKIVAKRKYGENDYTTSLPAIKEISIDKVGDVYEPPVIGKPPLQLKDTTQESLTIAWAEKWYEVMASQAQAERYTDGVENLLAKWGHSRVYLSGDSAVPIHFRDPDKKYGDPIDLYGSSVQSKIQRLGSIFDGRYILRSVTMGSNTHYKLKVIKQTEVEELIKDKYPEETDKFGKIEKWVMNIDLDEIKNTWTDITESLTDTTVEGVEGKSIFIKEDYNGQALVANTAYIVLISACREIDGDWYYSVAPSYILGTTATDHMKDLETPTTPRLYNYESKDVRDTEVTVRWIYNEHFEYELVYSRLDDPDEAEVWEFTEDDKKTFVNGAEAYVTVTGLLPETTYNFWIRAKQKQDQLPAGATAKVSDWSTPVTVTTKTLTNPLPPSGLGLASQQSILEAGKDFAPRNSDYITIEWMKNPNDLEDVADKRITYSYVIEFADNPSFSDAVIVTTGEQETGKTDNSQNTTDQKEDEDAIKYEILTKTLIKFTNLRANMPYYAKVKTVLTFKDGDKTIIKESEFTNFVRILTLTSKDEYDGGENPNIVEYEKPIEQSFKNNIWTYELMDTAKITSDILSTKDYYYTITMEYYNNKHDASVRRVKMPTKILQTLSNQGMVLKIETNIGTYEIPGQSLKHYMDQYQATDKVQIDLTKLSATDITTYVRSYPETYVSGEKLQIKFAGESKSTVVNTFDTTMKVKMKLDVAGDYNVDSYFTYLYNYNKGDWESYNYQVENADNHFLTYNTKYTGLNALYTKAMPTSNASANYLMNALANTYNITGLGTIYEQTDEVNASQYVALMLGIASNSKGINLVQGASDSDYKAAKASGIYISNARGEVTREQALAGAVKLYEMKHGNNIKPSNMTFTNVSSNYRTAASKAYAVGMITSLEDARETVTYGELCDWIALAID